MLVDNDLSAEETQKILADKIALNVAKVFNKKGQGNTRNMKRAAKVINTLSPQEVYDALMNKLPYDETKHYLEKSLAALRCTKYLYNK